MKNDRDSSEKDVLIEEIEAKQRNIVFPDTVRNSRNVDAFLWKGSPDAPLVQRLGAWIFGLFFFVCGLCFIDIAQRKHSWEVLIYSILVFLLGGKVFRNGFRRRKTKAPKGK